MTTTIPQNPESITIVMEKSPTDPKSSSKRERDQLMEVKNFKQGKKDIKKMVANAIDIDIEAGQITSAIKFKQKGKKFRHHLRRQFFCR